MLQNKYSIDAAAYVSDEWNVSNKIKLSSGLRLSSFNVIGAGSFYTYDKNGNTIDTANYTSGQLVKNYTNLQPRFASVYQLNGFSSIKFSLLPQCSKPSLAFKQHG